MGDPSQQMVTFRELDEAAHCPKGTTFRAFKALSDQLREGVDYVLLRADSDGARIESLRAQGRIYNSSVNVVLLQHQAADRVRDNIMKAPQ
ncbi:hypothetical protein J2T60_002446 [Natronospira proteinivora]|uniref:Uncharacterized protein n=1 Tax=Natronospira proteinivora TaxID=1807133 RepID=A0ABT1GAY8_9GAMM|nr:hypothetical protein [Natronospira proteinivora]MCP1728446.1 hypothetical protein [Natronospira proteinivora]